MQLPATATGIAPASSRRKLLKNLGALIGTGLLATPGRLLARPAAPAPANGPEPIGMVQLLAGTTVPPGWVLCDGRVLPVAEHPALFALLGTTYGGDGRHTFALPNLGVQAAAEAGAAMLPAIKTANGPATTTALAELRLVHQRRPRARVA